MSLDELDTLRADLERSLDALGDQLFTLEQDPTVAALAGLQLHGESANRWAEAQGAITGLWLSYAQLRDRLTETSAVRDTKAARALLTETLVRAPLAPEGARVADLLDLMTRVHANAALVVSTISLTWDLCMPRLRIAESDIDGLTAAADHLAVSGVLSPALREELARLNERVVTDPLSVTIERVDELDRQIAACRDELSAVAALPARWPEELTRARETLERVLAVAAEAARAGHEARAKVLDARVTQPDLDQDGLAGALRALEDLERSGAWTDIHRALLVWHALAAEMEQRHRDTLTENMKPLDRRRELRGRLAAHRARSVSLGVAEDAHLELMFREARAALEQRPTHLGRTDALIDRYRAAIVAAQARRAS